MHLFQTFFLASFISLQYDVLRWDIYFRCSVEENEFGRDWLLPISLFSGAGFTDVALEQESEKLRFLICAPSSVILHSRGRVPPL